MKVDAGDLANLCDQKVFAADWETYADKIPAGLPLGNHGVTKANNNGFALILDAELEFVAICKKSVAPILCEIINRFEPDRFV